MQAKIFTGSIISTAMMFVSVTQAENVIWTKNGKPIGNIIVSFSKNQTTTTFNAEVIITDEIDKHYSGVQVSS